MLSPVRPSVVCNVRAPYSSGSNFRQYGIRYLGHPLASTKNFTEIVPGDLERRKGRYFALLQRIFVYDVAVKQLLGLHRFQNLLLIL